MTSPAPAMGRRASERRIMRVTSSRGRRQDEVLAALLPDRRVPPVDVDDREREPDVRAVEAREPDAREVDAREVDVRDVDAREPEVREPDVREPEVRELDARAVEVLARRPPRPPPPEGCRPRPAVRVAPRAPAAPPS